MTDKKDRPMRWIDIDDLADNWELFQDSENPDTSEVYIVVLADPSTPHL
jgi:hypothetical protein